MVMIGVVKTSILGDDLKVRVKLLAEELDTAITSGSVSSVKMSYNNLYSPTISKSFI